MTIRSRNGSGQDSPRLRQVGASFKLRNSALRHISFRSWGQYEEELRNWFKFDKREDCHYFYPFDGFVQLKEVIAGPLCTESEDRIKEALRDYPEMVSVIKGRLAFKTFRVVENLQGFVSTS